jgi:3-isopropylmalate dehydrogenase
VNVNKAMAIEDSKKVAVLAGDGIGPEVMQQALVALDVVCQRFSRRIDFIPALIGGAAFLQHDNHFPETTRQVCAASDAILFGSVGGPVSEAHLPQWKGCETNSILAVRKAFGLAANMRPTRVYPELTSNSPLRADIIASGVDLLILRELQGDVYFGEHAFFSDDGERCARDTGQYTESQIAFVARAAFDAARNRRRIVHSVDKANVLHMSKLWREIVHEVHRDYEDVMLEDILVDNCALQLVKSPGQFDVIVAPNLFGDILSDLAAALPGSLGLSPSASFNTSGFGLYEPSGGSAPDIAGKNIANPIAQIVSAAMMLRYSFGWHAEADSIERAVALTITDGYRTRDIAASGGKHIVSTSEMGQSIAARIR